MPFRRPHRRLVIAALAVSMAASTACSTGADRQAGADEEAPPKEVRVAVLGPVSVDPPKVVATDAPAVLAADLLFDGLTRSDGTAVEPELASSWESDDGVMWTFHLDATRRTSAGAQIDAAMVVASFERVRGMAGTSLAAARLDQITSVEAVDAATVRIVLSAPNRELPALLADPAYGVVPNATNAPVMSSETVTSGRFRVRTGGPEAATLVPVEALDDLVAGVRFVHVDDVTAAAAALADGKVDLAPLGTADVPAGVSVVRPTAATLVLELSGANGALADPATRARIVGALDRAAIARVLGGDDVEPAATVVPGAVDGPCRDECGGVAEPVPAGTTVRLDVPDGLVDESVVDEIVEQLTDAGVTVDRRRADSAGLAATIAAGELQLVLFAVTGTAPTPDPYLAAIYGSVGAENLSAHASAAFDEALRAARVVADDQARRQSYAALEGLAQADSSVVPLAPLGERYGVAKRVMGVAPVGGRLFDAMAIRIG